MISISSLIYKSTVFLDSIYETVHENTPMINSGHAEFFFVANDATDKVIEHLNKRGYRYYIKNNPHFTEQELFAKGIGVPDYMSRVYGGYNEAIYRSDEIVVLLNSDIMLSPNWLENSLKRLTKNVIVTSRLVERNHPKFGVFPGADHGEFGNHPENFEKQKFLNWCIQNSTDGIKSGGAYGPCMFYKELAEQAGLYPGGNICGKNFHHITRYGDEDFFLRLKEIGVVHITSLDSIVYHFKEGEREDMKIKKCYFCKSDKVEPIFHIEDCPIAGNFLDKPEDDILLSLNILICKECGIAQLDEDCFVPKENLFKKYFYNTHSINTLRNFFYSQADELHNFSTKKLSVLEIGGNSCPLGERLTELGHNFINVDPSDTALANTPEKVRLINGFFDYEIASEIKEVYGQMDIIYSANNFAHMEDLISVIRGIHLLLTEDGKLIIQVQDFEYLLKDLCFPFFYHEHLFYYTSYTLSHFMNTHGFKLVECSKNDIHGGSINCVFKKTSEQIVVDPQIRKLMGMLDIFISKIDKAKYDMNNFLNGIVSRGERVVAYGASGQANILFAKFGITKKLIPYIIDDAPLKLGKITPYSHIEIKNSDFIKTYKPNYIIVTAYNFINEIRDRTPDYTGKWVVPLPDLKEI